MSIMEQQMQDQIEGALHEQEQLALACVSGSFIDKRYIKCPHTSKSCKWQMSNKHRKGYEYLNGACYLSGSFKLDCPD
jgi:hypothetical protein